MNKKVQIKSYSTHNKMLQNKDLLALVAASVDVCMLLVVDLTVSNLGVLTGLIEGGVCTSSGPEK